MTKEERVEFRKQKIFCLYFHINLIKTEIFYVGIGIDSRPFDKNTRSKWWKYTASKYGYDVTIIHENLTWDQGCELEIKYIKQIGRRDKGLGPLVNQTDGGDGCPGSKSTKGIKKPIGFGEKVSKALTGRKLSKEHIKNVSNSLKGKISWNKGKSLTAEHCENMSISMIGKNKGKIPWTKNKKCTVERADNISKALSGRIFTDEWKKKLSDSHKGQIPWNKGKKKQK